MDFKLDPLTHDLVLSSTGQLVRVTGIEAIVQAIKIRLLTFDGEWFLDDTIGLLSFKKWFGTKTVRLADFEEAIKQTILETPGVTSVASITLTLDHATRKLRVDFVAKASTEVAAGFVSIASATL